MRVSNGGGINKLQILVGPVSESENERKGIERIGGCHQQEWDAWK